MSNRLQADLVCGPYKIFAKVLSNRLKEVLYEITDGKKSTFINDKQILDLCLSPMSV